MGCNSSKSDGVVPPLTEDRKNKVRESWAWYVEDENLVTNACFIFVKLFTVAPAAKELYSFVDEVTEEALVENEKLHRHARRLVDSISLVVDGMDDLDLVSRTVQDIGGRHVAYGAKVEHMGPVGEGVMYSLKRTLKNKFSKEHEKAWEAALGLIGQLFIKGLQERGGK